MAFPCEPTVKQRYLMYQRTRIVESKRQVRAEKLKEYTETHPGKAAKPKEAASVPPSAECSSSGEDKPAGDKDESDAGGKAIPLVDNTSAILCNIVIRKFREEREKSEKSAKKMKE